MTALTLSYPAFEGERRMAAEDKVACQAFAACDRPATGAFAHPVLGAVLSCGRCAERLDETLQPVSVSDGCEGCG